MKTSFEKPGTFPKTRLIGRTVRLLLGVVIFYLVFPPFLRHYEAFTRLREGWEAPGGTWPLGVLLAAFLLPHIIDRGFTVQWGHRSQLVFAGLAVAAVVFDLLYYGSLWGPPLGWLLLLTTLYVFGHLGLSFIVAGIAATPGWEVRALSHVLGRVQGHAVREHGWEGGLTHLDRWEASRRRP